MRPLGPRGLPFLAATMAAVALGAPAEAAPAEHLTALAPPLEAAGRLATLASQRAPAPPTVVFPVRGRVDWGEQDARFGAWRGGHVHEGQDVFAPAGTPLFAIRDARVVETGTTAAAATTSRCGAAPRGAPSSTCTCSTRRGSGSASACAPAQRVGSVGCTGSCWGDHLHLEVRIGRGTTGRPLDPLPLLRRLAARRARPE